MRHLITTLGLITLLLATAPTAAAQTTPQSTPQPPADEAEVDPRFGVIESFWEAGEAAELGVGWDRILFYWNEIQPTGPDDWNTLHVLEEWLDDARAQNRVVTGLLKNTPTWATDGQPFSGVPRGLDLPVDDPDNLWAGYVRKVVEYYAPLGVHHWIIWNEPEIEAGVYGHEFGGSTAQYYRLLKVAYQVAKEHDPQAVVHLAGWSYWHDPNWLGEFLRIAVADPEAKANNYFFDVITLHIYFRVETVEQLVEETWAIQERYGLKKPIWINETNASPNLDPLWPVERPNFQVDLEQQAWYLVQAHALGFGARSARIGVYKLLDILLPPGGESFGILRPDGSRRPAFDAYQATVRYLSGFTYPVGRQQSGSFYAFAFNRPEGVTRILWARTQTDVTLRVPALADEALLVSATGEEQPLRALDGFYRIRLRGARCAPACDIGGPPIFIVESGADLASDEEAVRIDPDTAILMTATPVPTTPAATATTAASGDVTITVTPPATATSSPTPPPPTPTPEPATATATSTATPSPTLTASPTTEAPTATPTVTATTVVAVAELPAVEEPPDGSAIGPSNAPITSWLFIGAAVVLGVVLVFATRKR
ncbi:exported protein of unknown function [Candidatus Promineifilum breve]|uniref:Asl1-like glycosyl hydrolase catalytic domain-containing protein n=1 Tax=Candidatus Promineifilum breve TaxID=1806508 RepID=A0A170PDJ4_9CHLR|nr:hypothetical protein [Candidatus Promineifilum breve]CUS02057.2 exported protein of unknown function [Candidatus Promineifilum breve]